MSAVKKLTRWLNQQKLAEADIEHTLHVIKNQSYSVAAFKKKKLPTLEGRILQDADRLEAIGAIGIARCFAFGGRTARPIYDPTIKVVRSLRSTYKFRYRKATSINHFYEKLLRIKDLMNTTTGKKLARERHRFMQRYLDQFFAEMTGQK